jgi:hypothetical protein
MVATFHSTMLPNFFGKNRTEDHQQTTNDRPLDTEANRQGDQQQEQVAKGTSYSSSQQQQQQQQQQQEQHEPALSVEFVALKQELRELRDSTDDEYALAVTLAAAEREQWTRQMAELATERDALLASQVMQQEHIDALTSEMSRQQETIQGKKERYKERYKQNLRDVDSARTTMESVQETMHRFEVCFQEWLLVSCSSLSSSSSPPPQHHQQQQESTTTSEDLLLAFQALKSGFSFPENSNKNSRRMQPSEIYPSYSETSTSASTTRRMKQGEPSSPIGWTITMQSGPFCEEDPWQNDHADEEENEEEETIDDLNTLNLTSSLMHLQLEDDFQYHQEQPRARDFGIPPSSRRRTTSPHYHHHHQSSFLQGVVQVVQKRRPSFDLQRILFALEPETKNYEEINVKEMFRRETQRRHTLNKLSLEESSSSTTHPNRPVPDDQ